MIFKGDAHVHGSVSGGGACPEAVAPPYVGVVEPCVGVVELYIGVAAPYDGDVGEYAGLEGLYVGVVGVATGGATRSTDTTALMNPTHSAAPTPPRGHCQTSVDAESRKQKSFSVTWTRSGLSKSTVASASIPSASTTALSALACESETPLPPKRWSPVVSRTPHRSDARSVAATGWRGGRALLTAALVTLVAPPQLLGAHDAPPDVPPNKLSASSSVL